MSHPKLFIEDNIIVKQERSLEGTDAVMLGCVITLGVYITAL